MENSTINLDNFDKKFGLLLKKRKKRGVARVHFDIENMCVGDKINLIVSLISNTKTKSMVYKICFWENDDKIFDVFNAIFCTKNYKKNKSYKNGIKPGVVFIDDDAFDETLLSFLLLHHFNFELAREPALNMKIWIFVQNQEWHNMLFDIYDDRGFYVYFLR